MIWQHIRRGWKQRTFHNSLADFPAFLVCNGPSFREVDADKLKGPGRIVMGVNNVYPKLKPDYWFGLDGPSSFDCRLYWEAFPKFTRFLPNEKAGGHPFERLLNVFFVDVRTTGIFYDFSENAVCDWTGNSMLSALWLLMYMGVRKIYFIGTDLTLARGDYADGDYLNDAQRRHNTDLMQRSVHFLRKLNADSERRKHTLISCTPNSELNHFMRFMPLEDAILECERGIPSGRQKLHVMAQETMPVIGGMPTAAAEEPAPVKVTEAASVEKRAVLVLKSGGDYQPWHVARMVAMLPGVKITLLTDLPRHHFSGVDVIPLRHRWRGWWSKMEMFRPGILDFPFLFIDLDADVRAIRDEWWQCTDSVALAPFTKRERVASPSYAQSSMMFIQPQDRADVWRAWNSEPMGWMRKFRGDQDFLSMNGPRWKFWQDLFPKDVVSYKQNILSGVGHDGLRVDAASARVVMFHGKPRPWELAERRQIAVPPFILRPHKRGFQKFNFLALGDFIVVLSKAIAMNCPVTVRTRISVRPFWSEVAEFMEGSERVEFLHDPSLDSYPKNEAVPYELVSWEWDRPGLRQWREDDFGPMTYCRVREDSCRGPAPAGDFITVQSDSRVRLRKLTNADVDAVAQAYGLPAVQIGDNSGLSLAQIIALMRRAKVHVGPDSGLMHLALTVMPPESVTVIVNSAHYVNQARAAKHLGARVICVPRGSQLVPV